MKRSKNLKLKEYDNKISRRLTDFNIVADIEKCVAFRLFGGASDQIERHYTLALARFEFRAEK